MECLSIGLWSHRQMKVFLLEFTSYWIQWYVCNRSWCHVRYSEINYNVRKTYAKNIKASSLLQYSECVTDNAANMAKAFWVTLPGIKIQLWKKTPASLIVEMRRKILGSSQWYSITLLKISQSSELIKIYQEIYKSDWNFGRKKWMEFPIDNDLLSSWSTWSKSE